MVDPVTELTLDAELDLGDRLPLAYRKNGSRVGGIAAMLFGGLFSGAPFAVIVMLVAFFGGNALDDVVALIVLAVLFLGGLAILLMGLAVLRSAHDVRIDRQWVSMRTRTLLANEQWQEPLNSYAGVAVVERLVSSAGSTSSHTLYCVTLQHRLDSKRHVPLYASRNAGGVREASERFATLLALPVLGERADGVMEKREAADLDASVRQRVAEGSLPWPPLASRLPPTPSLRVRETGEGCEFRVGFMSFGGFAWSLLLMLGGAGLGAWRYTAAAGDSAGSPWMTVAAVALLALGVAGLVITATGNATLTVQPEGVTQRLSIDGWHVFQRSLAQQHIEDVIVTRDVYGRPRLEVIADAGRLAFSHWNLDVAALENMRERVVTTLAAG